MKFAKITLSVALLGALTLGMAEDIVVEDPNTVESIETTTVEVLEPVSIESIDTQIAEIQAAPEEERVELMNELKEIIASLNEEDRAAAIEEVRSQMETIQAENRENQEAGTGMRNRVMQGSQETQMQASEDMLQMQNMNQNRVGNQFMDMSGGSVSDVPPVDTETGGRVRNMNFNMR